MAKAKARPASIQIEASVMKGIEKHAYSRLDVEVGGMLFGSIEGKKTIIAGSVPAAKASAEQISLTFTHEVWDDILQQGQKFFPDMQIVGWYHTHPSFGLFLSEYDSFIQQNFFQNDGQVALVIDPIAGNLGWFNLNKSGHVVQMGEEKTLTGPKESPNKVKTSVPVPQQQGGLRTIGTAVLATAMIAGAAGYAIASIQGSAKYTDLQNEMQNQVMQFNSWSAQIQQNFGVDYTVKSGDTIRSVTDMFFGAKADVSAVISTNPDFKTKEPKVGDVLHILHPANMALNPDISVVQEDPTPTPTPTPTATK